MTLKNKDLPLVSVIAVSYNHQDFIEENLNSIANQTYSNIELIICDDASTDDSIKVIENWRDKSNLNSKFLRNIKNKGLCKTLNEAIEVSNGKYLNFIACDDVLMKSKIKRQIESLEKNPDCKISCSNYEKIDVNGDSIGIGFEENYYPPKDYFEGILNGHMNHDIVIHSPTLLIKKDVFEEVGLYDVNVIQEDLDMLLKITNKYPNVNYIENVLVKYRILQTSLSRNKKTNNILINDRINTINKHLSDPNTSHKYLSILKTKRASLIEGEIYKLIKDGVSDKNSYQHYINKLNDNNVTDEELSAIENIIITIYLNVKKYNLGKALLMENLNFFKFRSPILFWLIKKNIPPRYYKTLIIFKKLFS